MNNGKEQHYIIKSMEEKQARKIAQWSYEPPYSIYNMGDDPEDIEEIMDGTYYSVHSTNNELVGFFCFGRNAQVPGGRVQGLYTEENFLDIGLGMRPDLTGKGRGLDFMQAGLEFGQVKFAPAGFRLTVAAFNQRAYSLYKRAGFQPTAAFLNINKDGEREFIVMERI